MQSVSGHRALIHRPPRVGEGRPSLQSGRGRRAQSPPRLLGSAHALERFTGRDFAMIVRRVPFLPALLALGLASCDEPQPPPPPPPPPPPTSSVPGLPNLSPVAPSPPANPFDQLLQACTRYDEVEALIREIDAERAGLPPPPPPVREARAKCPRGAHRVVTEPLKSLKEEWARTNPPPETRLQQLERIGRQSGDDIVRLVRMSPRVP